MSLPQSKLRELQTLVSHFSTKRHASKKQLQQLAEKLNWACWVVFGGRTFLHRILDTMNSLTSSSARCRLSETFHLDIQWWKDFLAQFNGTHIFMDKLPVVDVHTDACSIAAGAFFKGDWFYHNFLLDPPPHALLHVNHEETLAMILAAKRCHQAWSNKHVIIHSDNEAAVHIFIKGSTDNPVIMSELRALFWLSATFNFCITGQHIKGTLNTVADSISRLHNPTHVLTLNQVLSHWFPAQTHLQAPLHYHISDYSSAFLFSRFAPGNSGTQSSYRTHRNTYFRFCAFMGYDPVPVNPEHLCQYTAFHACSLCVSSISQYLNVIGILHRQFGLPNPLLNNWPLKTLLTGIRRYNSHPPHQKLPIKPVILLRILSNLNMSSSFDAFFWVICLVVFFGMFCKPHLFPTSTSAFDARKQLTKDDFQFSTWGALLTIRWSKTIQFRECVVRIPLPLIPYSPLRPVMACSCAFRFTYQSSGSSQAFNWLHPTTLSIQTFTYHSFSTKLRGLIAELGLQAGDYTSHPLHRGGASFAYQAGVRIELIKVLGDWKSNAVLLYLTIPLTIRLQSVVILSKHILSLFHPTTR